MAIMETMLVIVTSIITYATLALNTFSEFFYFYIRFCYGYGFWIKGPASSFFRSCS